jgi:hypothetical protein
VYILGELHFSLIKVIFEKKQYGKTGGYLVLVNENSNVLNEIKIIHSKELKIEVYAGVIKMQTIAPMTLNYHHKIQILLKELQHGK